MSSRKCYKCGKGYKFGVCKDFYTKNYEIDSIKTLCVCGACFDEKFGDAIENKILAEKLGKVYDH